MSSKREQVNIRLHREDRRAFEKAARSKHKKLSEWLRDLAWRELERQKRQSAPRRAGRNGDRRPGAAA